MKPLVIFLVSASFSATVPAVDGQTNRPPTVLEEPATLFEPREPRNSIEEDRLIAAAHFAEAQWLLKRGKQHRALDNLERAWRYDPDAHSIAHEIISLASRLSRRDEATRYAVLAAERGSSKPSLLTQLGAILVNRGEDERGLRMFETAEQVLRESHDIERIRLNIEIGRLYLLRDEPQKAAARFGEILSALNDPSQFEWTEAEILAQVERPDSLFAVMGESFLLASRFEDALSVFRRLHSLKPNDPLLALREARVAAARENWQEAAEKLDVYFSGNATSGETAPFQLLDQLIQEQESDPETARTKLIDRLQDLHRRDQNNPRLAFYLAEQLSAAGADKEAIVLYEALVARRPALAAYRKLAAIRFEQRDASMLLEVLVDVLTKHKSLAGLQTEMNLIAENTEFVTEITSRAEGDSREEARRAGVLLAIAAGDFESADRLYRAGIPEDGHPSHEMAEAVGLALFMEDEASRAAAVFRKALSSKPPSEKRPLFYYYLASALALDGQHDAAIEAAERAAALNDAPRFQSRPAWIAYHAKRYDDARARYQSLLDRFADDYSSEDVRSVIRDARLVLSNINVLQERLPAAEEQLERVLDEFPDDIGALNDLGYLWADQGKRLTRALAMVEQAVKSAPENRAYRDSLGWTYFRLGQFENAVRELEVAADEEQPDGVILDHLGDAYERAGRVAEALDAWRSSAGAFDELGESAEAERVRTKIAEHAD